MAVPFDPEAEVVAHRLRPSRGAWIAAAVGVVLVLVGLVGLYQPIFAGEVADGADGTPYPVLVALGCAIAGIILIASLEWREVAIDFAARELRDVPRPASRRNVRRRRVPFAEVAGAEVVEREGKSGREVAIRIDVRRDRSLLFGPFAATEEVRTACTRVAERLNAAIAGH
ncbi:MAG: hypothetical protein NZM07_11150 [Elioraea sp.]|nr:hypothetical protein [Elioraea sp.]